jgi:hypothetical protein
VLLFSSFALLEFIMQINRVSPSILQALGSKVRPVERPAPVQATPPVIRQRYSEDPAVAAAIAEMNAYTGLGKRAKRF